MSIQDRFTAANVAAHRASVSGSFPHMSKKDSAVWRVFLATHFVPIKSVYYDVTLGGQTGVSPDGDTGLEPLWKTLTAKRVDAVVYTGNSVWTVEVKPIASMAALGQALTYKYLWDHSNRPEGKARAVIVCSRVDDDVEEVLLYYEVLTIVVDGPSDGAFGRVVKVLGDPDVSFSSPNWAPFPPSIERPRLKVWSRAEPLPGRQP